MTQASNLSAAGHNGKPTPCGETYGALDQAYRHFNDQLFAGRLPECIFVFQRKKINARGHFHGGIWSEHEGENPLEIDEISLNPNTLNERNLPDLLSTLVHEMTHLEQHHFGEPSRNGYHNKAWGKLMDAVGLTPTNTGQPGGKRTGQQMTHFIEPGGPFDVSCAALLEAGFVIPWLSRDTTPEPKEAKPSSKTKFTCPQCQANAWAKPATRIGCCDCDMDMIAEE